jgi:hypothetical protein
LERLDQQPPKGEAEKNPGEGEEMLTASSQNTGPDREHDYEQEHEEGGETSLFLRKECECFGGTECEDEMEEREPAETPTKNTGGGNHCKNEDDEKQSYFPTYFFEKGTTVHKKSSEQRSGRDKAAGEFCRAVWHRPRQEIRPVHRPRWQDQARPCIPRDEPLPVSGGVKGFPRGAVDVIKQCQAGRGSQPKAERDASE